MSTEREKRYGAFSGRYENEDLEAMRKDIDRSWDSMSKFNQHTPFHIKPSWTRAEIDTLPIERLDPRKPLKIELDGHNSNPEKFELMCEILLPLLCKDGREVTCIVGDKDKPVGFVVSGEMEISGPLCQDRFPGVAS